MRTITLSGLKLALADLFDKRHAALVLSSAGKTYEPILLEKKSVIDALPPALTGGKPLADELTETDLVHDGFGAAIWHITEAYERCPTLPDEQRAAARRIRAALIPQLEDLKASYVDEAHAAATHKADLAKIQADLDLIPVAGGVTLLAWANGFINAGETLDVLLSKRADLDNGARSKAGKIRTATIAVLNRFRGALADEVAINAALPKDLDAQVFGYFDQLEKMRAASGTGSDKKDAPAPAPSPATPPGGGNP